MQKLSKSIFKLATFLSTVLCLLSLSMLSVCAVNTSTYDVVSFTNKADFEKGEFIGTTLSGTVNTPSLQLSKSSGIYSFLWIPNSDDGTVSKIDATTGIEMGRYYTGGVNWGSPSRTTVDNAGNAWVCNRNSGTVVKIGLSEGGNYKDLNGNGKMDTSSLGADGKPTLLPWGTDECVLMEISVIPGSEGSFSPGTFSNYSGVPGPRALAIDKNNNIFVGTLSTQKYYHINISTGEIMKIIDVPNHSPYGALIDRNGYLWSSGCGNANIIRMKIKDYSFSYVNLGFTCYGIGIDQQNNIYVSGWDWRKLGKVSQEGTIEWIKDGYYCSRGVAVSNDGDIWVANSGEHTVTRWSPSGIIKANIYVPNQPMGISIGSDGYIWVVSYSNTISKINPSNNTVVLQVDIPGAHYAYSDMTGSTSTTITTKTGNWVGTYDSGVLRTTWHAIEWTQTIPANTVLALEARTSINNLDWSPWVKITKNEILDNKLSESRYLQVRVNMGTDVDEYTPSLSEINIYKFSSVTSVNLPVSAKLGVATSMKLNGTVLPADGYDTSLTWTTADPTICLVDNLGRLTGMKAGSTTITATSHNGVKGTCIVEVNDNPIVHIYDTGIFNATWNTISWNADVPPGGSVYVRARTSPDKLTWNSWKDIIMNEPLSKKLEYGRYLQAEVRLFPGGESIPNLTGFTINQNASIAVVFFKFNCPSLIVGQKFQMEPSVYPENATKQKLIWESKDPTIATVDSTGLITAISVGSTKVSVTTEDGSFTSEVNVEVTDVDVA